MIKDRLNACDSSILLSQSKEIYNVKYKFHILRIYSRDLFVS